MKKILLSASLAFLANAANAQSPTFNWAKGMGGTHNESGNAITVDKTGNVYATGNFINTVTFDASNILVSKGNNDVFITKHNASGSLVWVKQIGGISDDLVRGIVVDDDYVYITGNYNQTCDFDPSVTTTLNLTSAGLGDIFVAKYEILTGNLVWAKSMGGTSADLGFGIAVDKDGYVYTTGNFAGTADFNPSTSTATSLASIGSSDVFVSKLDKDGNFEWAKSMGSTGADGGVSLAIDHMGDPVIGGSFVLTADFDPSAGITNLTSLGSNDIFVTKFNSMGLIQWVKQIGGTGNEYLEFLSCDKWGNTIYTARYENGADFDPGAATFNLTGTGRVAVSKLRNNGDFAWAKKLGSAATSERSKSVAVDTFGNVFTVGEFEGTNDFDPGTATVNLTSAGSTDVFISKLDSNGNYSWAIAFGGFNAETGNGIAVASDGSVYSTGAYFGTCDFDPSTGTTSLTGEGGTDIFVHKMSQCIINKSTTLSGSSISANMAGATYQWVSCPSYTAIAGATAQTFTPSTSGNYAVIITNGTGCTDTSDCVAVVGTGIAESTMASNISIYPNPANNVVVISNLLSGQSINIINTLGVSVYDGKTNNSTINIDVNAFASGMYFVQILQDGQLLVTRKLLISK